MLGEAEMARENREKEFLDGGATAGKGVRVLLHCVQRAWLTSKALIANN